MEVRIETSDGVADAHLLRPATAGRRPGVLFYMDGLGLRPQLLAMAQQLADRGYVVLLPDLYYRSTPHAPFDAATALSDEKERERLFELFGSINGPLVMSDTESFMRFLASHEATADGLIGCVGYCMGGGFALRAAGTFPERFGAAASFHGANLATERADSPHTLIPRIRGSVYVGVAEQDPWLAPGETARLRSALESAGVRHEVELYPGTQHGFAVADLPVYDRAAAELHWQRLLRLLSSALDRH